MMQVFVKTEKRVGRSVREPYTHSLSQSLGLTDPSDIWTIAQARMTDGLFWEIGTELLSLPLSWKPHFTIRSIHFSALCYSSCNTAAAKRGSLQAPWVRHSARVARR